MANNEQLDIIKQGAKVWNKWRKEHPETNVDLSGADLKFVHFDSIDLTKANLQRTDFFGAKLNWGVLNYTNLSEANLSTAQLYKANLEGAILNKAVFYNSFLKDTVFTRASLTDANLREAYLDGANLTSANLSGADLKEADLSMANLSHANLERANLSKCRIYGISVCKTELKEANQLDLIVTQPWEPSIYVDHLKIAQFIYLLLNNEEVRDAINTITSKIVLILGHFIPKREVLLDVLRDELRKHNYIPLLFEFEKTANGNSTESLSALAQMARFIIADITNAASILQELRAIVPHLQSTPIQPLLQSSQRQDAVFDDLYKFPGVLTAFQYQDANDPLEFSHGHIIETIEQKARELAKQ